MDRSFSRGTLGATGLDVGRLGVAASYGAPAGAFEEAFERGCNYFYFGSGRRRAGMRDAVRALCGRGQRDGLVLAVHSYARVGLLAGRALERTLRSLGTDRADVLILGWHNRRPSKRLVDRALALKEKGLCRFLGMSGHNRSLFPQLAGEGVFDVFHIRYNAAHRGAEQEAFPGLAGERRPGVVTYTATKWGQLLDPAKTPAGESPLSAMDCYRFVLSNPAVDIGLCGPASVEQMREALSAVDRGPLDPEEEERVRSIGDHVYGKAGLLFR